MSRVSNLDRAIADWIHENPLRTWRHGREAPMSQAKVAIVIGRSTQAVRDYESGSYRPDEDVMSSLAGLLGIKPDTLQRKWTTWMKSKPRT